MKGVANLAAYNTCPICGAHLDPGEKCNCEYEKALAIAAGTYRNSIVHELKINKKYFKDVINGIKTFELRKFDRDFQKGDEIFLSVYENNKYQNYGAIFKISYILSDCPQYGLMEGYCILGIEAKK